MENENSCGKNGCNEDCESCSQKERKNEFSADLNRYSNVKHTIGVVSGKGGVGKSLVTSLLASLISRKGFETAVLDADVTGPSIPKMFGLKGKAKGDEIGIFPMKTHSGISVMSINLLLDNEEMPVIWRGPIIGNTVKQFWTDVVWGNIDYMFIDMPPGTGDVPLTVFQSIPVDGIIIVTSPQDLVSLIVKKAYNMAKAMNIPVLGIVENMSYFKCPDCGRIEKIFGESRLSDTASEMGLDILGRIPIDPKFAQLCDKGEIERCDTDSLDAAVKLIETKFKI